MRGVYLIFIISLSLTSCSFLPTSTISSVIPPIVEEAVTTETKKKIDTNTHVLKSNTCYSHTKQPVFKTSSIDVETKSKYISTSVMPASYKKITEHITIKEPAEKIIVETPAVYKNETRRVITQQEYTTWKKGPGDTERVDETTGQIMHLVTIPAQYKTTTKKVFISPAKTRTVLIPGTFETITRQVIHQPAKIITKSHPSTTTKTPIRIKVGSENAEWEAVLCKKDTTPAIIIQLQTALKNKGLYLGFADGILGDNTLNALTAYQRSQYLSEGHLTIAALTKLNILKQ